MGTMEHKHKRFRQGRDYHITLSAKEDYAERFPERIEALDSPAIYGRISRELNWAAPVEIDKALIVAMGYPPEDGASFLCVSDPDEKSCNDPVFVQRNGNITTIWRPEEYRERKAQAHLNQATSDSTLGSRIGLPTLKRMVPSAPPSPPPAESTDPPEESNEMHDATRIERHSSPEESQRAAKNGKEPDVSWATVTLAISSEQAVALFAELMREGHGTIGNGPIIVELTIRK